MIIIIIILLLLLCVFSFIYFFITIIIIINIIYFIYLFLMKFFLHFDLIWLKLNFFPALRAHNENKAFLLVLCYPCHMQSIFCEFSC